MVVFRTGLSFSRRLSECSRIGRQSLGRPYRGRFLHSCVSFACGRYLSHLFSGENEQQLNFRQFVRVLAHFQPINRTKKNELNSRRQKLRCKSYHILSFKILSLVAFQMYDLNKNGYITREEFKVILNSMVGANITADQLDKIADRTIEEADGDNDGRISFEEFCRV